MFCLTASTMKQMHVPFFTSNLLELKLYWYPYAFNFPREKRPGTNERPTNPNCFV